jgi:fumarate reductase subunit D
MNRSRLLTTVTIIAALLVLVITVLDFLALTDIRRDYVSQSVFDGLDFSPPIELPDWTETRGEWLVVTFSIYARLGFLILNLVTLWVCMRRIEHHGEDASQKRSDDRDVPLTA